MPKRLKRQKSDINCVTLWKCISQNHEYLNSGPCIRISCYADYRHLIFATYISYQYETLKYLKYELGIVFSVV